MEDKDKFSPASSDGKPNPCSTESKSGMNSRNSDVKDKSRHAKARRRTEEAKSDKVTMPSTSSENSRTIGKFSTCATPISMLSPKTSERKIHAPEKNAKPEGRYIVLRTEKELRDYFAAMDRAAPQASPAPDPQPTRSCLSRSSFGSSRSGSGHSVKSVRFADIEDESDKKNKHSDKRVVRRRSRTLMTGERDMQPIPTRLQDQKTTTSTEPPVGHDNRQSKTEVDLSTIGNALTIDNINGGENQPQTSSESLVSAKSSTVHTENKSTEITSCTGSQDTNISPRDKVHNMGKIGHSVSPSASPLPAIRDSDNCSRTVSYTSSRYSSSGLYTSCSDYSADEYSRSESTCSSYSHDRRTPNSENSSCCLEKCNTQSISKSYTIVPAAEKSPDESPTPRFDNASSSGSSEYHSRSESRYSENNNSRCSSSVSDSPQSVDMIHNKGKRCRGRLSSPKQRNKPKLEDKVFRREPKNIGPGTKTLKIDFQMENKSQKQCIHKVPKNGKTSSRLSPKINASIKCETSDQTMNTLRVMGVPLHKKDRSQSSVDAVENPYDNDLEEDMESEKTKKDTSISEKSQDNFWNVDVEKDHQGKQPVIPRSSKHSTTEFPHIKRRDKTDLIQNSFLQKDPDPEPDQKLSEISMVGTGFDSLATGKQDVKSQKVRKREAKARGNKITREKPHVLKNDPQDLSALIAKELLGDKYQTRKKGKKEQRIKNTHRIQTDKAMEKQKLTQLPTDMLEKQNAAKDARKKKNQIERLVAADNLYQNKKQDHVRGMMVMGMAKSSPYLNQTPGRAPKPCPTATTLPIINTADDNNPCHSIVSGHTNAPVDMVLPKLCASRLLPQHIEARGGDRERRCNNARMPCKLNHSYGDIGYNRRKSDERNPSQANDRTLPRLPGPPVPLQAEASLCNGALQVTILDPSGQGGHAEPIKLTILHKSRGTEQRMRSSQHQSKCGQETEPVFFRGKGRSQQINTEMKSRKIKRGFSHQ